MPSPQFSMWLLTVPVADFVSTDALPNNVKYIKGQQEVGAGTGYQHWQLFVSTTRMTLVALKRIFPTAHIEPTRSVAAEAYVFKEDTRVEGTQFEIGVKPFKRNSKTDWNAVRTNAQEGSFESIPDDVFVRYDPFVIHSDDVDVTETSDASPLITKSPPRVARLKFDCSLDLQELENLMQPSVPLAPKPLRTRKFPLLSGGTGTRVKKMYYRRVSGSG